MNILLINNNPVVSRLLSLCTRDESIILEEIIKIGECKRDNYDIVFIDESSYKGKVQNLNEYITTEKKVLFTHTDMSVLDFDVLIQKPFLPSQILEVLESLDDKQDVSHEEVEDVKTAGTEVLDGNEVEKIKELLEMNEMDYDNSNEVLSDEEYEARKVKVIKEQLIADGLEIVEENEILEEYEVDKSSKSWKLSDEEDAFLDNVKRKKIKNKSANKKNKKLAHKEDDLIVQAVEMAMRTLKKKQRKQLLKGKEVEITIKIEGKN